MPATPSKAPRVAVLADSDSRWKWGALTAQRLAPGSDIHGYLLRGRATPTPQQLKDTFADAAELRDVTLADFLAGLGDPERPAVDLLVLSCVGHTVQAALHGIGHLRTLDRPRPVVATGYVGVVYEKLTEGLLHRHGADLMLANSAFDLERFRTVYDGVGADSSCLVPAELPFLGGAPYDPEPAAEGRRPYRVVFAIQPSVPGTRRDRLYLLRRAIDHARRHPGREVVVKERSRPGEHTTHVEEWPYLRLAEREKGERPPNLRFVYGSMGEVLDGTDLLVTVSSTAALESLRRGIPTAVLTDLGVREPMGNHYFVGSGCFASWDDLDGGYVPAADPDWLAQQGVAPTPAGAAEPDAFAPARARLEKLLALAERGELPPLSPYYSARNASGYLPRLLARHGLDEKGAPLPGRVEDESGGRFGKAARRVVRRTARRVYRTGVQRVAPLIRRLGRL